MKRTKSVIIATIIVFILVFGGYFATKTVMTKGAINYLQDKYNMSYNQITVLDYEMKKFGNDTSFLPLNTYWSPYKWEIQYNDKSFFVNRIDGKYYDDYQLDEIESVATEWFKQNVDNNIVGIKLSSANIINYQARIAGNITINENNIKDFLNDKNTYSCINRFITCYDVDLMVESTYFDTLSQTEKNNLLDEVKEKLPNSHIQYVVGTDKSKISKERSKSIYWLSEYNEMD
ncbi:hypothetical protein [uncultured Eubacterium sp.]|uniref:hypothetical protein n=1 Tax=uncultured Eubacterium sp. TaxID=165185 RepID=UPI00261CC34D|nr:hypothetical protein [uncultured Eubacterium sp.]